MTSASAVLPSPFDAKLICLKYSLIHGLNLSLLLDRFYARKLRVGFCIALNFTLLALHELGTI